MLVEEPEKEMFSMEIKSVFLEDTEGKVSLMRHYLHASSCLLVLPTPILDSFPRMKITINYYLTGRLREDN